MYSYLYNWFYFTEDELIKAQQQVEFSWNFLRES